MDDDKELSRIITGYLVLISCMCHYCSEKIDGNYSDLLTGLAIGTNQFRYHLIVKDSDGHVATFGTQECSALVLKNSLNLAINEHYRTRQ